MACLPLLNISGNTRQASIRQGGINRSTPLGLIWEAPGMYEVKLTEKTQHCGSVEATAQVTVLRNPIAREVELKILKRCPTQNGERITLQAEPAAGSQVIDIYNAAQGGTRLRRLRTNSSEWEFTLSTNQTYYYEILDTTSGCGSPAREPKEIKVQKLQIYNARATEGAYCEYDSTHFIASPFFDSEGKPFDVEWKVTRPNGTTLYTSTYDSIAINWEGVGIYTVSLSAKNSTCPVFTINLPVRVIKRPGLLIEELPGNQTCIGSRLRFKGSVSDVQTPLQYEWRCQDCKFTTPRNAENILGPLQNLEDIEVFWVSGGIKTLTLVAKSAACGEVRHEYIVNIKMPPVPVACNYPRLVCQASTITITFTNLPTSYDIELFTTYQGGQALTLPYTYPNGNRVEIKNRNEAHFWVQASDIIFYGVRDLFSNCPSFYRIPIVLNYDTTNRIRTPSVTNSPIYVCRQSTTPFTFQVSLGETSAQQWVYFIKHP
ncbi:MAG: hypothetical protein RML72_12065 [Bacteroidia bacterium]|nr:hypothetical protein [Bacteroidia bacterium]MDW8159593.1 hypothetical protein [Bacteroidia bacterium]